MLRTRIFTAIVLACVLLAGLFLLPAPWAVVAFGAVFTVGAWEWGGFRRIARHRAPRRLRRRHRARAAARLAVDRQSGAFAVAARRCVRLVADRTAVAVRGADRATIRCSRCSAVCRCWCRPSLPSRRLLVATHGFAPGPQIVLWLVLLVIAADIGAYFAGRRFGRRKLAPRVSPGKTWEGALGGLALVALVAWGGAAYFELPRLEAVVFGCAVGIFSIIGDLTESMFKRGAGLKDSGALLPGHGGLLDRIDSVTAAAPLYALGLFSSGVIA